MNSYPLLDFLVRHGHRLAAALGAVVFLACLATAWSQGGWLWGLGGLIGGALTYGFVASYAELVRLVTDMLLPK